MTPSTQDSQPGRVNATAASLLGLLDQCGELTGGELLRTAQVRIGDFWSLTRSQVYRELKSLAERGYVEAGALGARESQPFRITDAGRAVFREWLTESLPEETIRIPLLLLVGFGRALPPGRLRALLDAAEQAHRATLAGYEQAEAELRAHGWDPYVLATLSFGLHYERAVLAWLDSLPPGVRGRRRRGPVG